MELVSIIEAGLSLTDLAIKLKEYLANSNEPKIENKVLDYLKVIQVSIRALGKERQGILSDADRCDLQNIKNVDEVLSRMRTYLKEDNVRDVFISAVAGLDSCEARLEKSGQGLKFRKHDKQNAFAEFKSALQALRNQLNELRSNFFPEYSGQGLQTLSPVYDYMIQLKDDLRSEKDIDIAVCNEEMSELILEALRDEAHDEWMYSVAKIERLINEIQFSFSVKDN